MFRFYDTYARKLKEFKPINPNTVGLYTCGPTVYNFAHLGNLKTFLVEDFLKRALEFEGLKVRHVMNITDVGHLTSDEDEGEDKLEKGARRENRSVWELAKFYTDAFISDIKLLNIELPDEMPQATEHIKEQLEIIAKLVEKGFTYETAQAIYFDVSKFPGYSKLTGQKLSEKQTSRETVYQDPDKHHPADFALWFKLAGRFQNHAMHWPSPYGEGFPGWHIECSAMSAKYLGQPFDIHTGGIDHVTVHHPNEIAQSESAFGTPLANYWLHSEHMLISQGKMAKSQGNFLTLKQLVDKKFDPMSFRYLVFSSHYRSKMNFTWESLTGAQNALNNLYDAAGLAKAIGQAPANYLKSFKESLEDDLNTPKALSQIWDMLKDPAVTNEDKIAGLLKFDEVLGLNIKTIWEDAKSVPDEIKEMVKVRDDARTNKDFKTSDELRKQIEKLGFILEDTASGSRLRKKR